MKIRDILVKEIFDSRGEPTIEVGVRNSGGEWFFSQVPSGKSKGSREAQVFIFSRAGKSIKKIKKSIVDKSFDSIGHLDEALIRLDGTKNKSKLGGNVIVGISIAFARALAAEKNKDIWMVLRDEFFAGSEVDRKPLIFSNLINGGSHASNNLAIQEYLVIVRPIKSYFESIKKLIELYKKLGEFLGGKNKIRNITIGDEGGYAIDFKNNFEPVQILEKLIVKMGFSQQIELGLDIAATSFYKNRKYNFEGKKLDTSALAGLFSEYIKNSKLLVSVEDPFAESDAPGFKKLVSTKRALVVGDDLTVTNPDLIDRFSKDGAITGVIIKPNQIGTITETCRATKVARQNNLKIIISHRSGETEDNFIIHFAKACGADGIKIGAPARERISKFNELIRIYPNK